MLSFVSQENDVISREFTVEDVTSFFIVIQNKRRLSYLLITELVIVWQETIHLVWF